ncbi:MAG: F0F1 ATP synthase subunit epsilon [Patescibacteria group bacterium]|nr:F0F1 ATP synthase subunit epsilon [Patescibacteria group bacterium]MDE1944315.1 F0F1 ATP synthase subunit epsilon [Patescibacteria group bacterium]MDE1945100.1 F0F1 ATP synthase subunit epsilon [Patescibacteria group bacterium]MDE2057610.1 F0F1 ATP synthase subunit epsilon [Patescibacteria group bacterium]
MARTFHVTIARVGENLFDGEALSVTLPGADGVFEVLAGHEPFVSPLTAGEAHVVDESGERYHYELPHGGIAEISRGEATVLL